MNIDIYDTPNTSLGDYGQTCDSNSNDNPSTPILPDIEPDTPSMTNGTGDFEY